MKNRIYKVCDLVVIEGTHHFYSAFARGSYRLEYELGKITTALPDTVGLFGFTNFNDAEYFARMEDCEIILEAIGIELQPFLPYLPVTNEGIDVFYKQVKGVSTDASFMGGRPPVSTVLYKKIKPIQIVE